jgi:hypothetical protein
MVGAPSRRARLAQRLLAFVLAAALVSESALAQAQDNPAAPAAPAATTDAGANAAPSAAAQTFSREELEKLLAPIALYPDPLLAQLLAASVLILYKPPSEAVLSVNWLVPLHLFRDAPQHLRGRLRVRRETAVGQPADDLGLAGGLVERFQNSNHIRRPC